jgi:tetratricopeptide (TPR) repeat protein
MYDFDREIADSDFEKIVLNDVRLRKQLKLVRKYADREEWDKVIPNALSLWKQSPENEAIAFIVAYCLVQLGVREQAIGVFKVMLEYHKPTPEICSLIMQLATKMEIFTVAEKMGRILLEMKSDNPSFYVDYVMTLNRMERYDEAIELCQEILPIFQDSASLWNALGSAVMRRDGEKQAIVFYQEALRLSPDDKYTLNNMAMTTTDFNEQKVYLERAYKLDPEHPEINMGLGLAKFGLGELIEAHEHYALRLDPSRSKSQHIHYTHKLPDWDGSSLRGKTLFATCEQGIGDEVMFSSILPQVYEDADQLIIGVDRRLVSSFQRSFPKAIVCGYVDKVVNSYRYRTFPEVQNRINNGDLHVDYACPFATIISHYWKKKEDVVRPTEGYLKADPELVQKFKDRIAEHTTKPVIGLAWASGVKSKTRDKFYPSLEDFELLFSLKDHVAFVNLQYTDVTEDLQFLRDRFGVDVINFDDVNLKLDIEANLAIMQNCIAMVGVSSAPGMFAMSSGVTTFVLTFAEPWWRFGHTDGYVPFARDGRFVSGQGWEQIMPALKQHIEDIINVN